MTTSEKELQFQRAEERLTFRDYRTELRKSDAFGGVEGMDFWSRIDRDVAERKEKEAQHVDPGT